MRSSTGFRNMWAILSQRDEKEGDHFLYRNTRTDDTTVTTTSESSIQHHIKIKPTMLLDKFDLLEDLKLTTLALDVVNVPFPKNRQTQFNIHPPEATPLASPPVPFARTTFAITTGARRWGRE